MKLNEKELACYAQSANGKADKEGILWIKEYDGKSKKREGPRLAIICNSV